MRGAQWPLSQFFPRGAQLFFYLILGNPFYFFEVLF
jgi:hypothetical protein